MSHIDSWKTDISSRIKLADEQAHTSSIDRWNSIAKPIGGLGRLESAISQIASITGSVDIDISKRALAICCADNGVLVQGVSQSDYSVTTVMTEALSAGQASVNKMAQAAGIDVFVYDFGVKEDVSGPIDRKISNATMDISQGPAMTVEQAMRAIEGGIEIVEDLKSKGYSLIATGEMGVGNTTTSSALASVMLGIDVETATGKGSGMGSSAHLHKIEIIRQAIDVNGPFDGECDVLELLSKLGGFDIAALAGVFVGGAIHRVPIIADGLISCVSALIAKRAFPGCEMAILGSHVSEEPAARALLAELGIITLIDAGMRLGEGSGAVASIPLLDMAAAVYMSSKTFDGVGMQAYEVDPQ